MLHKNFHGIIFFYCIFVILQQNFLATATTRTQLKRPYFLIMGLQKFLTLCGLSFICTFHYFISWQFAFVWFAYAGTGTVNFWLTKASYHRTSSGLLLHTQQPLSHLHFGRSQPVCGEHNCTVFCNVPNSPSWVLALAKVAQWSGGNRTPARVVTGRRRNHYTNVLWHL